MQENLNQIAFPPGKHLDLRSVARELNNLWAASAIVRNVELRIALPLLAWRKCDFDRAVMARSQAFATVVRLREISRVTSANGNLANGKLALTPVCQQHGSGLALRADFLIAKVYSHGR